MAKAEARKSISEAGFKTHGNEMISGNERKTDVVRKGNVGSVLGHDTTKILQRVSGRSERVLKMEIASDVKKEMSTEKGTIKERRYQKELSQEKQGDILCIIHNMGIHTGGMNHPGTLFRTGPPEPKASTFLLSNGYLLWGFNWKQSIKCEIF